MDISYEFQLRAAENGHRYRGFVNRGDVIVPACSCGWKGEPQTVSVLSMPKSDWAEHVLDRAAAEPQIRTKDQRPPDSGDTEG